MYYIYEFLRAIAVKKARHIILSAIRDSKATVNENGDLLIPSDIILTSSGYIKKQPDGVITVKCPHGYDSLKGVAVAVDFLFYGKPETAYITIPMTDVAYQNVRSYINEARFKSNV